MLALIDKPCFLLISWINCHINVLLGSGCSHSFLGICCSIILSHNTEMEFHIEDSRALVRTCPMNLWGIVNISSGRPSPRHRFTPDGGRFLRKIVRGFTVASTRAPSCACYGNNHVANQMVERSSEMHWLFRFTVLVLIPNYILLQLT